MLGQRIDFGGRRLAEAQPAHTRGLDQCDRINAVCLRFSQRLQTAAKVEQLAEPLAIRFAWHWDVATAGIDEAQYRGVLRSLLAEFGFQEAHTGEPNVRLHAANFLMVRTGAEVTPQARAAFAEALHGARRAPAQRLSPRASALVR